MDSIDKAKRSIQNFKLNFEHDLEIAEERGEMGIVNLKAKVDRTLAKVLSDLDGVERERTGKIKTKDGKRWVLIWVPENALTEYGGVIDTLDWERA